MPCRIPSSLAVSGLRSPCIWAGRELSSFNAQVFPLWIAWPPSPHSGQDHILPRILISTILGALFSRIQCSRHQHLICQARSPIMELFFIHFSGCVFDIQLVIDGYGHAAESGFITLVLYNFSLDLGSCRQGWQMIGKVGSIFTVNT